MQVTIMIMIMILKVPREPRRLVEII